MSSELTKPSYLQRFGPVDDGDGYDSANNLELEQEESEQVDVMDCVKEYMADHGMSLDGSDDSSNNALAAHLNTSLNTINTYHQAVEHCNSLHCNQDDGAFTTKIIVKRTPQDLPYNIETSRGTLTPSAEIVEKDYAKTHNVALSEYLSVDANFVGEPTAQWEGSVRGVGGVSIPTPTPVWNTEKKQFEWGGVKAFGVLHVKGTTRSEAYTLTIPPREGTTEDTEDETYSAVVSAFWDDQVTQLEVTPPEMVGNCAGVSVKVDPDDDPDPGKCDKITYYIDGCSGEEKRYEIVQIDCQ